MSKRIIHFIIVSLSLIFTSLKADEAHVHIQINKSNQFIQDLEKFILGQGLHKEESKTFYDPITTSFLETIKQFEPMLGIQGKDLIKILNGDLDIYIGNNGVKAKLEYEKPEIASEVSALLNQLMKSKGIVLTETKNGEVITYNQDNKPNYFSVLNNRIYIQLGKAEISNDDKVQIHRAISPILKFDEDSFISIDINKEFINQNHLFKRDLQPLQNFFDGGIKCTIGFKDGYYAAHSEINIPKLKIFDYLLTNDPISKQALGLIAQDAEFAMLYKFELSKILEAVLTLNELDELKTIDQKVQTAKSQLLQATSIDLQSNILDHLGNEIVISAIPEQEAGGTPLTGIMDLNKFYMAITLKNGQEVEKSITKLLTFVGQISMLSPIATLKDGYKEIKIGEYKAQYIKFAYGALTPCFLVKDNALFITNNIPTLEYIVNNSNKWGSIDKNTSFLSKIPISKNINGFTYSKFTGNKDRPNYTASLVNSVLFGGAIFVDLMGNEKINPGYSGRQYRQIATILKPIVANIDFTRYPANKYFHQELKDNYFYFIKDGGQIHTFGENGYFLNNISSSPAFFTIPIIASIALPNLMSAQKNSRERAALATLRSVHSDQETYKNDNQTYATLKQLADSKMVDLPDPKSGSPKNGFYYIDLISNPNQDFYAVLAIPSAFGSSASKYLIVTSEGKIRQWTEEIFPYKDLPANQESLDMLRKLPESK